MKDYDFNQVIMKKVIIFIVHKNDIFFKNAIVNIFQGPLIWRIEDCNRLFCLRKERETFYKNDSKTVNSNSKHFDLRERSI